MKVFIFEETIHEDDEFAHAGGDCNQRAFAFGTKPLVEVFEDSIVSDGTECGHVEGCANVLSPTSNMAGALVVSAVAIVGSQARQCCCGFVGKGSQFGHFRQNGCCNDRPDSSNGIQAFGFVGQLGVCVDEIQDGFVARLDLSLQHAQELPVLSATERVGVVLCPIGFGHAGTDQLAAPTGQLGQLLLLSRGRRRGMRTQSHSKCGEDRRVYGIGFCPLALGAGEVTNAAGLNNGHRHACGVKDADSGLFVTAGGFANDLHLVKGTQQSEQLNMPFTVVGQEVGVTLDMELQRGLGNIEAGIEDSIVVLTHTCGNASREGWTPSRSSNGSSLDQRASAERALWRITLRAYAKHNRSRTCHCLPACRRGGNSSLIPASTRTKRTIFEIQELKDLNRSKQREQRN